MAPRSKSATTSKDQSILEPLTNVDQQIAMEPELLTITGDPEQKVVRLAKPKSIKGLKLVASAAIKKAGLKKTQEHT